MKRKRGIAWTDQKRKIKKLPKILKNTYTFIFIQRSTGYGGWKNPCTTTRGVPPPKTAPPVQRLAETEKEEKEKKAWGEGRKKSSHPRNFLDWKRSFWFLVYRLTWPPFPIPTLLKNFSLFLLFPFSNSTSPKSLNSQFRYSSFFFLFVRQQRPHTRTPRSKNCFSRGSEPRMFLQPEGKVRRKGR